MSKRFFHRLGASLLDRTICASAGSAGHKVTLGSRVGIDMELADEAKLIIFWGCNAITSSVHFWARAQQAKRRGARLIAIDPYRSLTAEKCHTHIALLPGTDAALALGLMHVLIRDDLIDHDYVSRHTLGFEALCERVSLYGPEKVAAICGIGAAEIESLAHLYATARPALIRANYGLQRARGGGMAMRNIACLPALVGAFREAAGGIMLSTSGNFAIDDAGAVAARPAGREDAAHHQHVEHRPRAPGHRGADSRAHRLQLQSGGGRARFGARGRGLRARGSFHRGPRALPDRYRRLCGHRAAGDDAARASRCHQALRALLHGRQQSRDPASGRSEAEHRDFPSAGKSHGICRSLLRRIGCGDRAVRRCHRLGFRCGARAGLEAHRLTQGRCSICRRRLRYAVGQGGVLFHGRASRRGSIRFPTTSRRSKTPAASSRSASRWR